MMEFDEVYLSSGVLEEGNPGLGVFGDVGYYVYWSMELVVVLFSVIYKRDDCLVPLVILWDCDHSSV